MHRGRVVHDRPDTEGERRNVVDAVVVHEEFGVDILFDEIGVFLEDGFHLTGRGSKGSIRKSHG
jgi:hypothetical protein